MHLLTIPALRPWPSFGSRRLASELRPRPFWRCRLPSCCSLPWPWYVFVCIKVMVREVEKIVRLSRPTFGNLLLRHMPRLVPRSLYTIIPLELDISLLSNQHDQSCSPFFCYCSFSLSAYSATWTLALPPTVSLGPSLSLHHLLILCLLRSLFIFLCLCLCLVLLLLHIPNQLNTHTVEYSL